MRSNTHEYTVKEEEVVVWKLNTPENEEKIIYSNDIRMSAPRTIPLVKSVISKNS
jgi:deoxyinosine 3'endonuclease (endonuclease V)